MSRFGRDYLIVGNYISRVFPFLGVRFIAVNDGIDSIRPADVDSLDTSFKALIYDLYSRDLSRKIRSAKRFRAQKGEYLAAQPLYGYAKDPDRKNHLVIDLPAAEIVRRIFKMVGDGVPLDKVAKQLNEEGVLTPMQYKVSTGCVDTAWNCINKDNFWTEAAVLRIVRNEEYLGSTVYGRRYYDIIGQGHSVKVSKKDWIVVPGMHKPVVSQEAFDRAQAALHEYKERQTAQGAKTKIRCGVCGHAMGYSKTKQPYFYCRTLRVTDAYSCPQEHILEAEIHAALLDSLRQYAGMVVDLERMQREQDARRKADGTSIRRELRSLQEGLAQQKQKSKSLYEAFALGEMEKSEYLTAKTAIQKAQEGMESKIAELGNALDNLSTANDLRDTISPKIQKFVDAEDISREMMDEILDVVLVFPGRRLEIQWKYQDEVSKIVQSLA